MFAERKSPFAIRPDLQGGVVPQLLISSDSHVQVSHDAIKERLASTHHEQYDEAVLGFMARMMSGAAGANQAWATERRRTEGSNPKRFSNNSRPGYHDGAARLEDMDLDGVHTEVIFSEVSFFRYWGDLGESQHATTIAFNEALRDFAAADPDRLVVSYQIPIQDVDEAIAEVERIANFGGKSLQLPVFPPELGCPDYYHERYDPLLACIQETGLPICCHIGLNTGLDDLVRRDPTPGSAIMVPMAMLSAGEALGMWIMSGTLERFPGLKLVFVEPGIGWIAWWLNLVDDMVLRQGYELPDLRELPSHYFRENVFITFVDEAEALAFEPYRERIGVENMMWSSDYPHPVSSFPNSREIAERCVAPLPDTEQVLITSGNAARVWNL
jgi:predicted TIM-barrel fold metal-dependent hydrolase